MKRGNVLGAVVGSALGIAAAVGAVSSQTDWLAEPTVRDVNLAWEPIPVEVVATSDEVRTDWTVEGVDVLPDEVVGAAPEPMRTHEVVRAYWELDHGNDPAIDDVFEEAAVLAGVAFNICPELILSVCEEESHFDPTAVNGEHVGLMQCSTKWFAKMLADMGLAPDDLYDPEINIYCGTKYLRELFDQYEDPAIVLMAFNGDATGLKHYYQTGELSRYAQRVLERSEALERVHGK